MFVDYEKEKFFYGIIGSVFLSFCLFVPLFERIFFPIHQSTTVLDYLAHINIAEHISEIQIPHLLFHVSIIYVQKIFSLINIYIDLKISTIIVMVFCETVSCIILYCFFYRLHKNFYIFIASFLLIVVAPNYLLHKIDICYYLGFLHPNPIHNPTSIVLKPIALLLFVLTEKVFFNKYCSIILIIFYCILIVLSALAKPSYIIIMLPSLFVLFLTYPDTINRYNLFTVCTVCFLTLAYMYANAYYTSGTTKSPSGIVFTFNEPFQFAYAFTSSYLLVFSKHFFSILFPLYVYLTCYKECKKDILFQYSIMLMFFAIFFYGFVVESGPRKGHGNFTWSALIATLLLFVSSFKIFINKYRITTRSIFSYLGYFLFSIHVFCGLYYYFRIFQGRHYF